MRGLCTVPGFVRSRRIPFTPDIESITAHGGLACRDGVVILFSTFYNSEDDTQHFRF